MRQYEPCIQIIIIIIIKDKNENKKEKSKGDGRGRAFEREIFFFLSSFLSKIYGNRTVGFRLSRR